MTKSKSEAVLLSRDTPHKSAEKMHEVIYPTAIRYGEDWYEYSAGAYRHLDDLEVECKAQSFLEDAFIRTASRTGDNDEQVFKRTPFNPKNADVAQVCGALKRKYFRSVETLKPPAFLEGIGPEFDGVNPKNLISCQNLIVDFTTGQAFAPTDRFFTMTALPIDFDPDAECPLWLSYLDEVFGGDAELIRLTQQMFGYIISGDTSYQRVFYLRGRPRSGKGTMIRVMGMLLGKRNVASPTIRELANSFGLENVLDKTLLTISELNADDAKALSQAVSIILQISGEDDIDINRKNMKMLVGHRLAVRIVLAGNQFPNFKDHATAMAARLLVLPFDFSFVANPDPKLSEKLVTELPGILNWAIAGLADLRSDERFIEPDASKRAKQDILNSGDPVRGFVAECCEIGIEHSILKDDLFDAYRSYCRQNEAHPLNKEKFGAGLLTAFPNEITASRPRDGASREHVYRGIRLRDLCPTFLMVRLRLDPDWVALFRIVH
jgi:putative DNA primase/helicase